MICNPLSCKRMMLSHHTHILSHEDPPCGRRTHPAEHGTDWRRQSLVLKGSFTTMVNFWKTFCSLPQNSIIQISLLPVWDPE